MTLRGSLMAFTSPVNGMVPTLVPFQYNPAEVTRVIKPAPGTTGGSGLRVAAPPTETYTLKLELDALDGLDKPITGSLGIAPLLASIEAMLEPAGTSGLGALTGAVGSLLGGGSGTPPVPAPSLQLVVLAWSATRVVPVRIDSCTVHETGFDAALQPVQASVDLSVTVLRSRDLSADQTLANIMATAYQVARTTLSVAGMAQGIELST